MQKVKGFLKSKTFRTALIMAAMAAIMCVMAFAEDGSSAATDITSAFTTGFTSIVSDSKSMIAMIVPIALGLAGVVFLVKKAMGWFKGLAKG